VAGGADDEGLAPDFRHEGGPSGLSRSRLPELVEAGDLVDCHRGAGLAELAFPSLEPSDQLLAGVGRSDAVQRVVRQQAGLGRVTQRAVQDDALADDGVGGGPAAVQPEGQRLQRGPQYRRLAEAADGRGRLLRPVEDLRGRAARVGWAGGVEGVLVQDRAQLALIWPVTCTWPGQYGRDRGQRFGEAGPGVGGQGRPLQHRVRGGLLVPGDDRGFREVPRRRLAGQRIDLAAPSAGGEPALVVAGTREIRTGEEVARWAVT